MHPDRLDVKACGMFDASSCSDAVPTPIVALTSLGVLIVVLGLFAAGSLTVVLVGLGAICSAGVLGGAWAGEALTRHLPGSGAIACATLRS